MEDQEAPPVDAQEDSNQRGIRSFFSKFKQRAVKSLICSSSNVVPSTNLDAPGVAPSPQQEDDTDDEADASFSSIVNHRSYGVVDLKIEALEMVKIDEGDGIETYEVVEDYPDTMEANEDDNWEENMWKKLYLLKNENTPIEFRLYLVEMVRYAATINDMRSMGVYITQLQREYHIYDNFAKIVEMRARSVGRTMFRVDRVAEDLIIRLVTLRVGSDDSWKRTVNLICDRLKKNMAPKPKVDVDELPKILFRGRAITATDVSDSWFQYPTIDLTGYDLQGNPQADMLRRRLEVYLSLRPIVLVKLNLSYTGLDKKCFLPILAFIANLQSLQELDLRGNRLDTSILKYFYPFLGKFGDKFRNGFASLRWVYFNHNVDISRLPTKFIMGIDRRWPPIEHRPTPQELSDSRAVVCDFSKTEKVRAKLTEKRAQIQKRAKQEKEMRDRKKAAFLRRIAAAANQVLTDESLIGGETSDMLPLSSTTQPDIDGSDAGRTGRIVRLVRAARATRRAARRAAANANGNNAEGNDNHDNNAAQEEIIADQNIQNRDNVVLVEGDDDGDDDGVDDENDVYVDNYFENVSDNDSPNAEENSTEELSADGEEPSSDREEPSTRRREPRIEPTWSNTELENGERPRARVYVVRFIDRQREFFNM